MAEVLHDNSASGGTKPEYIWLPVKIAFFNAVLVLPLVLFDSYTFGQAGFPCGFAPRYDANVYYFVTAGAFAAIFLSSFLSVTRCRDIEWQCLLPWLFTAGIGGLVAFHCFELWAALRQTFLYMGGALPGVLAVFARYSKDDPYKAMVIDADRRIEWIKERANFWRTVAISGTVAFVVMVGPWYSALRGEAERMTTDRGNQTSLMVSSELYIAIIFVYMVMCPIYQSFRKAWVTDRLLLVP